MIRKIFDLFRQGRAEGKVFRRDPFILVNTFAPGLIDHDSPMRQPAVESRWTNSGPEGLRMLWTLAPSDDFVNHVHTNADTAA